jgi:hypothetical protein
VATNREGWLKPLKKPGSPQDRRADAATADDDDDEFYNVRILDLRWS